MMDRGQERFNIYCATCHGWIGEGDGMTAFRADKREEGTWVPPTSLQSKLIREEPVGQIFHTISDGTGKMPSYAAQIPPEDRWAIMLYIRALAAEPKPERPGRAGRPARADEVRRCPRN